MDRDLSREYHRQQWIKRIAGGAAVLLALFLLLLGFRFWLSPSLDRNRIRIAIVEAGPIEATISASGLVVVESERVLASPIDTRLLRCLVKPGEGVRRGDPIVVLDTSLIQLELENLEQSVALKQKSRDGKGLALEKSIIELSGRKELKQVDLEAYCAKVDRHKKLLDLGLISSEEFYEANLQVKKAEIELIQIERSMRNLTKSTGSEIEGIDLEIRILAREKQQKEELLERAGARADRDGVVTWAIQEEGTSIRMGEPLARLADLGQFKVRATLSDVYTNRLKEGMPVRIKLNAVNLGGELTTILPTIEDGTIKLLIRLKNPAHPDLRANLRADVFIITERKDSTLRVKNGPFINGGGPQDIFVIRANQAFKTRVHVGMSSFEYVEVLDGAEAGESLIISDMSRYMHLDSIKIKGGP